MSQRANYPITQDSRFRLVADPNYKGNVAHQLQKYLPPKRLNAAFRAYAEAMESAQVLELGLSLLLVHIEHESTTEKTFKELHDLHGYLFKRPLGNLIQLLKKKVSVPPQLEADLTKALDLRNLIAHRYFRERWHKWLLPFGLKDVTKELKEIRMTLDLASKEINRLTQSLCKKATPVEAAAIERVEKILFPALGEIYALERISARYRKLLNKLDLDPAEWHQLIQENKSSLLSGAKEIPVLEDRLRELVRKSEGPSPRQLKKISDSLPCPPRKKRVR